jgi:hypothetical protein
MLRHILQNHRQAVPNSQIKKCPLQKNCIVIITHFFLNYFTVNITNMTNPSCCEHSIKTPDDGQ